MICPKCESSLSNRATSCVCGWKNKPGAAQQPERPPVACSFANCALPAILRRRTNTGIANLCDKHDQEVATLEARAWRKENGLDRRPGESQADWRARMREFIRPKEPAREGAIATSLPDILWEKAPAAPTEFAEWDSAPAHESELI